MPSQDPGSRVSVGLFEQEIRRTCRKFNTGNQGNNQIYEGGKSFVMLMSSELDTLHSISSIFELDEQ